MIFRIRKWIGILKANRKKVLIAAVILVARRLKKTSARYRDEDRQEPKFHGPVYTVDYKDVDDEDEKDK